jgi:hypothetical protein
MVEKRQVSIDVRIQRWNGAWCGSRSAGFRLDAVSRNALDLTTPPCFLEAQTCVRFNELEIGRARDNSRGDRS